MARRPAAATSRFAAPQTIRAGPNPANFGGFNPAAIAALLRTGQMPGMPTGTTAGNPAPTPLPSPPIPATPSPSGMPQQPQINPQLAAALGPQLGGGGAPGMPAGLPAGMPQLPQFPGIGGMAAPGMGMPPMASGPPAPFNSLPTGRTPAINAAGAGPFGGILSGVIGGSGGRAPPARRAAPQTRSRSY